MQTTGRARASPGNRAGQRDQRRQRRQKGQNEGQNEGRAGRSMSPPPSALCAPPPPPPEQAPRRLRWKDAAARCALCRMCRVPPAPPTRKVARVARGRDRSDASARACSRRRGCAQIWPGSISPADRPPYAPCRTVHARGYGCGGCVRLIGPWANPISSRVAAVTAVTPGTPGVGPGSVSHHGPHQCTSAPRVHCAQYTGRAGRTHACMPRGKRAGCSRRAETSAPVRFTDHRQALRRCSLPRPERAPEPERTAHASHAAARILGKAHRDGQHQHRNHPALSAPKVFPSRASSESESESRSLAGGVVRAASCDAVPGAWCMHRACLGPGTQLLLIDA